eukprot:752594-Hanusia_phi.AAC.6
MYSSEGCPIFSRGTDWTYGLLASNYNISASDTATSIESGYLVILGENFKSPEVVDEVLSSGSLEVDIYCAQVAGAGCDGQSSNIQVGVWGNESQCLGCVGVVEVEVTGVGEWYIGTSNCSGCTCNSSGVPFVDGVEAQGLWNAEGTCNEQVAQGNCSCTAWDGVPITPAGRYFSIGNCSGGGRSCACNETGHAITPSTIYEIQGDSPDCNCTSDGVPITPPTVYNASGNHSDCNCSSDGVPYTPPSANNESYYCTCIPINYTCSCIPNPCSCGCQQYTCGCSCVKTCNCQCERRRCGYEMSEDGKRYVATGGNTCSVRAKCVASSSDTQFPGLSSCHVSVSMLVLTCTCLGFYDGNIYSNYSSGIQAYLLQDGSLLDNSYLKNATPSSHANGKFYFRNVAVTKAISSSYPFNITFKTENDAAQRTTASSFLVRPTLLKVFQTGTTLEEHTSTDYLVQDANTYLGNYTVELWGSSRIEYIHRDENVVVSAILWTGSRAGNMDSSVSSSLSYNLQRFLNVEGSSDHTSVVGVDAFHGVSATFKLHVSSLAGLYFQLGYEMSFLNYSFTVRTSGRTFQLSPSRLLLSYSEQFILYQASELDVRNVPSVVHLDGANNDTANVAGLPSIINVNLTDASGATLSGSNCDSCMLVRLYKCQDSSPSAQSTPYDYTFPPCTSVAQAYCATYQAGVCTSSGQFLGTLQGTTLVSVTEGRAIFSGLTVKYVFGAGYRLRFIFDSLNPSSYSVSSQHSTGVQDFPDPSWQAAGVNNSFFVLPRLSVTQSPGGEGLDAGLLGGDFTLGTPDGVPYGFAFKNQPIVKVLGDGYAFDRNWGTHGHAPLTALIKSDACGGGGCADQGLKLTGSSSPVSQTHSSAVAESLAAGKGPYFATFTGETDQNYGVELKWSDNLQFVGFKYVDLRIDGILNETGQVDLKLAFLCGVDTSNPMMYNQLFAVADSNFFDLFGPPDAPVNFKVSNYGALGFRLEFDPPFISGAQPLSGFIVEVDRCTDSSCLPKTQHVHPNFATPKQLGSDYELGGGRGEEVLVKYNASSSSSFALTLSLTPSRRMVAGDSLVLPLPKFSADLKLKPSYSCSSVDQSPFSLEIFPQESVLQLTVQEGRELIMSAPLDLVIPDYCNISFEVPYGQQSSKMCSGMNYSRSFCLSIFSLGGIRCCDWDTTTQSCRANALVDICVPSTVPESVLQDGFVSTNSSEMYAFLFPSVLQGFFIGNSLQTDNCFSNSTSYQSCESEDSFVLPKIEDESPSDLFWSGTLRVGSTSSSAQLNAACNSLSTSSNPCILTVGFDRSMFVVARNVSSNSSSSMGMTMEGTRSHAISAGDALFIQFPAGATSSQASTSISRVLIGADVFGWPSTFNSSDSSLTIIAQNAVPAQTSLTFEVGLQ